MRRSREIPAGTSAGLPRFPTPSSASARRSYRAWLVLAAVGSAALLLAPSSLGLAGNTLVLAPAFKGSVSASTVASQLSGCGKEKASIAKWNARSGTVTLADSAVARTCGRPLGYVGGSGAGVSESSIQVAIPVRAAHNGANSIVSSWTIRSASTATYSNGSCPTKRVDFQPALYQYSDGYCEAGVFSEFEVSGQIQDLQNSSWAGNTSVGVAENDSYWANTTDCYNYGTPTCSNFTGLLGYALSASSGVGGFGALTLSGATVLTLWDNGTHMLRSHHYVLTFEIRVTAEAFADQGGLRHPWVASAVETINLASLGNGATLTSITIT